MTIKQYVLDALGKFWTKLKSTYVTNCASTSNNLALAASQGKVLQDQITALNASLSNVIGAQSGPLSNVDANNIINAGVYQVGTVQDVTNLPSDVSYGVLRVTRSRAYIYQEYIEFVSLRTNIRRSPDSGASWSAWTRVPTRTEYDALNSNIGNTTALMNTNITQEGSLNIPNYTNYRGLLVIVRADSNNGVNVFIPKGLYTSIIPLSLNSKNNALVNDGTGYIVSVQGYVQNGVINITSMHLSGWTKLTALAYGVS